MPFQKLTLAPGINTQRTPMLNKGGWSASNLIRFREGLPEVKGGWTTFLSNGTPLDSAIRGLHAWSTLAGVATLGVGTLQRLYVCQSLIANDITPFVRTQVRSDPFSTTTGSSIVTVADAGHGQVAGNLVHISGAAAVAGLTINGEYVIASIIDGNSYTISVAPATANATTTGGGASVTLNYLLAIGQSNATTGKGWGAGTWGQETWGTERLSGQTGVAFPRFWTIDNWGENMIANARGQGGIFQWVASTGVGTRATILSGAPIFVNGVLVAAPVQMVVAIGCNPPAGGAQDPMLVAWSDAGDNTNWTPSATNQAGSFRLNSGSIIMQALPSQQQILIWTDTSLYAMQYIQPPLVWGFTQLGASCGAISPQSAGVLGGVAFWMSPFEFWMFSGEPRVIDCPMRDIVFKNLNELQRSKVICAINTEWSEVTWYYPSAGSSDNDSYITLNVDEMARSGPLNAWYGGSIGRSAWIDSSVFGSPISGDELGNVWNEEQGNSVNGAAMPWSIRSGYIDIANGEDFSFLDLVIPDVGRLTGGACAYTIFAIVNPSDVPQQYGPVQVTPTTRFLNPRLRARAIALQIDNSPMAIGNFWRQGADRFRIAPDGRN